MAGSAQGKLRQIIRVFSLPLADLGLVKERVWMTNQRERGKGARRATIFMPCHLISSSEK
jgi:hypothetical protein